MFRRIWRWVAGQDGPDPYELGRQYAFSHDLEAETPRVPEPLARVQADASAAEAAEGPGVRRAVAEAADEVERAQEGYDADTGDLREATARGQVALRDQDNMEKAEARRNESDVAEGRTNRFQRSRWAPWAHTAYSMAALPGEIAFTATALTADEQNAVLAWGTAITIGVVFYGASLVAGRMAVSVTRGRTAYADQFARFALLASITVGLMISVTLPILRARHESDAFRAQLAAFAEQGLDTSAIDEPSALFTFALYFVIYVAFFSVSALVAALTWWPQTPEEIAAEDARDEHADAVERFLESEGRLRAAEAGAARVIPEAIERTDQIWHGFEAGVGRFVEGLAAGHRGPLPEGWAQLARGGVRPAYPDWRENPPEIPVARYISADERARLLTLIEPADLPPLRPGERFAEPGAGRDRRDDPGDRPAGEGAGGAEGGDSGVDDRAGAAAGGPTPPPAGRPAGPGVGGAGGADPAAATPGGNVAGFGGAAGAEAPSPGEAGTAGRGPRPAPAGGPAAGGDPGPGSPPPGGGASANGHGAGGGAEGVFPGPVAPAGGDGPPHGAAGGGPAEQGFPGPGGQGDDLTEPVTPAAGEPGPWATPEEGPEDDAEAVLVTNDNPLGL